MNYPLSPHGRTLVVLDTNILLSIRLSDILFDMMLKKLFDVKWTKDIEAEFLKHAPDRYKKAGVSDEVAYQNGARRLSILRRATRGTYKLLGYEDKFIQDQIPEKVDPKDRHVVAAAIRLLQLSKSEDCDDKVILLTENLKDMAVSEVEKLGIQILGAGQFIDTLVRCAPLSSIESLKISHEGLDSPPISHENFLNILNLYKSKHAVEVMCKEWGISDFVPKGRKC